MSVAIAFAAVLLASAQASPAGSSTFVDARDQKTYRAITIGPLEWMAENLAFASSDSRCYGDEPALCVHFGRLYRIQDAITACPAGWRLPNEQDWHSLERAVGLPESEMEKTKGRGGDIDRKLLLAGQAGFDSLLPGWYDAHLGKFQALGRSAAYWSSTPAEPQTYWHYDLMPARGGIWRSPVDDSYWISVRCARDPVRR